MRPSSIMHHVRPADPTEPTDISDSEESTESIKLNPDINYHHENSIEKNLLNNSTMKTKREKSTAFGDEVKRLNSERKKRE